MLRPRFFLRIILLVGLAGAWPGDGRAEILRMNSEPGTIVRYQMTRNQWAVEGNVAPVATMVLSWTAAFEVLDRLPDGYRVAMTMEAIEGQYPMMDRMLASAGDDPKLMSKVFEAQEGIRIVYLADSSGRPKSIENLDEVRAAFSRSYRMVPEALSASNKVPAKGLETLLAQVEKMAARYDALPPEAANHLLLVDVSALFVLAGLDLTPGQETAFERSMPSSVDGAVVTSENRARIMSSDDAKLSVVSTGSVDRESFAATALILMKSAKPDGGLSPTEYDTHQLLENRLNLWTADSCRFRRADGWPETAQSRLTMEIMGNGTIDQLEATRLD